MEDGPIVDPFTQTIRVEDRAKKHDWLLGSVPVLQTIASLYVVLSSVCGGSWPDDWSFGGLGPGTGRVATGARSGWSVSFISVLRKEKVRVSFGNRLLHK